MPTPFDPASLIDGIKLTDVLRARLSVEGLNVVLPLGEAAFNGVCSSVGGPRMADLLSGGTGAIVVADGGPRFFARFAEASGRTGGDGQVPAAQAGPRPDPLDSYTRARMIGVVSDVLGARSVPFRILYPFADAIPPIPFQRLGQAAGLPEPGPLGLQIHPLYGPWWAYRAVVILALPLAAEEPIAALCKGCPRPCVVACPVHAVTADGFVVDRCVEHRLSKLECRESCAARMGCPVGATNQYSPAQLAFHMRASLTQVSLHRRLTTG